MRSLLLLALLLPGCLPVPAPRPHPHGPGTERLVEELARRWRAGALEPLAGLFTPECRGGCAGFVPTPTRLETATVEGQWWPRLVAGTLVSDLLLARRSYARLDRLELAVVARQVYTLEVALRVRLRVEGRDASGRFLRDQGELDLLLRETPAGLRIARFAPRRVRRLVTLLPEERGLGGARPGSRPSATEPDPEPEPEPEPEEPAAREPDGAAPPPSRPRLGALEVVRAAGQAPAPLRALAGAGATLLQVERDAAPGEAACEALAREARARRRVAALVLILDGRGGATRCALPVVTPTARSRRALAWLRPLLPALVLLDGEGTVRRVAGAGAGRLELLEALDQLERAPREH